MKRIPERMCVACRAMKPKKELARVVRPPQGAVSLDVTGKAGGRGAYICLSTGCLVKAHKSRALERALNTQIGADAYQALALRLGEVTGEPVPELPPAPPPKRRGRKDTADGRAVKPDG